MVELDTTTNKEAQGSRLEAQGISGQDYPALDHRMALPIGDPDQAASTEVQDLQTEAAQTRTHVENLNRVPPETTETQTDKQDDRWFIEKLVTNSNYWNAFVSTLNAILHGIATVTSFGKLQNRGKMAGVSKFFDKTAFTFTRWVAPFLSFGREVITSLINKRPIQALIKSIPPAFLPIVGNANIDTVYGTMASFNQHYDIVDKRLEKRSEAGGEFKEYYDKACDSFSEHSKMIWQGFKDTLEDFRKGKLERKNRIYFYNVPMILAGSLPILAFARDDRDSWFARATGFLRNLGGLIGDFAFIANEDSIQKKLVGVFCALSACTNVAKRWVSSEALATVLIHLSAALDVAGYAMWNAFSGAEKDQEKAENPQS